MNRKILSGLSMVALAAMVSVAGAQVSDEEIEILQTEAERGDATAQYNLGIAYAEGKGIAKDLREAARWYQKAAEQGYAEAQYSLGATYWIGEGVITNKYEAYIWYFIAKANGHKDAAKSLRKFNWRDYLSKSELRGASREAAWRLAAIENRKKKTTE